MQARCAQIGASRGAARRRRWPDELRRCAVRSTGCRRLRSLPSTPRPRPGTASSASACPGPPPRRRRCRTGGSACRPCS
jgi:hypothetical protein